MIFLCEIKSIWCLKINFQSVVIWFLVSDKSLQIVPFAFSETANQLEVCKGVFKLLLVWLNWNLETLPVADAFLLYNCFPFIFRNAAQCFS